MMRLMRRNGQLGYLTCVNVRRIMDSDDAALMRRD